MRTIRNAVIPISFLASLMLIFVTAQAAGPISGSGSRPQTSIPGGQQSSNDQTNRNKKTQVKAERQLSQQNKSARQSKKAAARLRPKLNPAQRKQFDTVSQLFRKATTDARARRQLNTEWTKLVRSLASNDSSMKPLELMEAVKGAQADRKEQRELRQAATNARRANEQLRRVRAELIRARTHQKKMARLPASKKTYHPARIGGVKAKKAITTQKDMNTLVNNLEQQQRKMSKLSEQYMLALQAAQQRQAQMMQTISNIMKSMHDTANSVIRNLR